jgi:hypothetical protein
VSTQGFDSGSFRLDADKHVRWRVSDALRHQRGGLRLASGERARSLAELGPAPDDVDSWIVFPRADTALLELHGELRFDALVSRVHGQR